MEGHIIDTNRNNFFMLYADCIPVKGYTRTMICDTANGELFFVDNTYYDLILELRELTIGEVAAMLGEDDLPEFATFLEQMTAGDLGTFVEDPGLFPPIAEEWDSPFRITDAIIDIRDKQHDYNGLFDQLNALLCPYVQIRSYAEQSPEALNAILSAYDKLSEFRHIEIVLKYPEDFDENGYRNILSDYRMVSLTFYASKNDREIAHHRMSFIKQAFSSCEQCGIINKKSMSLPGLSSFMEHKNHNSCLNRKISIDESGRIKNCPSMKKDYGDADNVPLAEVLKDRAFTGLWDIRKDQIKVCKDCEFRYICSDCRAYVEDPSDIYSKPLKCSYDPYTGQWEETMHEHQKAIL
ncbi:grasp-with-spasm system SPASM domain peptide maturase [Sinomicrobium oceani]|uniref:grasp-with-spasm system SPASM domain peptide maturase n=1 Tax=Sinomicrobium oceani TaxID=1150368 RepID=UPI00227AB39C|nr:grasp-with-spasm system SPASM domain peptide maturase [Sinomicrobium oceani]